MNCGNTGSGSDAIKGTDRRVQAGATERGGSALAVAPKLSVLAPPNQIPQGIYQATATPAQLIKGGYWVGGKLFAPPPKSEISAAKFDRALRLRDG